MPTADQYVGDMEIFWLITLCLTPRRVVHIRFFALNKLAGEMYALGLIY